MCGIVGYVGNAQAAPFLLDGMSKLEYRGYDSAGIAVYEKGKIRVEKCVGRLDALRHKLEGRMPEGSMGIGHTRWATHGRPSDRNSHPHTDESGDFVVVHNGIIENYLMLKEKLIAKGQKFSSDTDTEIVAHLFADFYKGDMEEAVKKVLKTIEGSYSLVFMCAAEPDKLICTKKDNPLIIGLGEGENFIASDIPAIIAKTRRTYIMSDGEIATVTKDGVWVQDINGTPITKKVFEVNWNAEAAEKGGFEHFMLKEIYEQPKAIKDTMRGRLAENGTEINFTELGWTPEDFTGISKIFIVACGTAYHAGIVGKYYLENLARIPVEVDIASEFRYRNPKLSKDTLVVIISQSGETADSLAALRLTKEMGVKTLAIVNVVGSSIAREADHVMYTLAGPEIAVATTKAYSTQLICMYILSMYAAQVRGEIEESTLNSMLKEIVLLPEKVASILADKERIQWFANKFASAHDVFFIGRGLDYAICQEGSLKMKEVSYVHSEAYAAGELKHGTISLIEDGTLVIGVLTQSHLCEKTLSNMQEVKSRGAYLMGVAENGSYYLEDMVDFVVYVPKTDPHFTTTLAIIPLQLMGYYVSVARGLDVDKPRNLAKSVTVE
mgnify:CR=1 FL=1